MGYMNVTEEDQYRIERMGMLNPTDELPLAGKWEGLVGAIPKGISGGIGKVDSLAGAIGSSIDSAADAYLPSWMASAVHYAPFNPNAVNNAIPEDIRKRNEGARDVVAKWAETGQDPRVTGYLGRALFGAAENLTVNILGSAIGGPLGAATLSGATFGHADYVEGKKQGLDDTTALGRALLTAGFSALGAFVPGKFGDSYTLNVVGGAATNVAFGMAQRGATSSLLQGNGYEDMADQYRIMDHEGILSDAILGSVFGGVAHLIDSRRATPDQVDVAAAMSTDEHYARSAPGIPTTPEAANLHGEAMREALGAMAEGREPNIPADTAQRLAENTIPDPQHDSMPAAVEAADAILPGFREAVDPITAVEPPVRQVVPETILAPDGVAPETTAEFPNFDPFTASRVGNLLKDFGDEIVEGPAGYGVTFREAIEQMHRELGEVDKMAAAHEVAAACFLRTGTAG